MGPLAYIEWYATLASSADPVHMMYEVKKMASRSNGQPSGDIVPLSSIRQSCQLIPRFPTPASADSLGFLPENWNSEMILDNTSKFILNNWASKYAYQTLW